MLPPAGEQSLVTLVMTLATRIMAFDDDRFEPFTSEELMRVTELISDAKFPQDKIDKALSHFEGAWREQVAEGFDTLSEELAPHADRDSIDVRFVEGLLRRFTS